MAPTIARTIGPCRRASQLSVPHFPLQYLSTLATKLGTRRLQFGRTAGKVVCGGYGEGYDQRDPSVPDDSWHRKRLQRPLSRATENDIRQGQHTPL